MTTPSTLKDQARREDFFREGHRMCPSCVEATALHAIGRATDDGRKTVLTLGTFCSEASTLRFPEVVAWGRGAEEPTTFEKTVGVIQAPAEAAPGVAEGARDAADLLADLGAWTALPPHVVAVTGDVGVAGGLDGTLHALRRGRVKLFVLLHEVYGASRFPFPATSLAASRDPVDHLGLALASGAGFVAQVSPSYPALFTEIAQLALAGPESAVVFVPAPCLSGWRVEEGHAAEVGRLECETGIAPAFRKRRGQRGEVLRVPEKAQRPRVEEYLARQMRFEHLCRLEGDGARIVPGREAEVAAIQAWAHRNVEHLEALARG